MPNSIDNTMFQQHQSNHHVMQPLIHFHARLLFISLNCATSTRLTHPPLSLTELSMFVPASAITQIWPMMQFHFPFFRSFLRTPTRCTCVFLSLNSHRDSRAISVTTFFRALSK